MNQPIRMSVDGTTGVTAMENSGEISGLCYTSQNVVTDSTGGIVITHSGEVIQLFYIKE